jgi:Family of unknown function (DUF5989)
MTQKHDRDADEFVAESQVQRVGLAREFLDFVRHNKKWWLIPILVVFLLVGLLVILGGTGAAPFIYTLF